MKSSPKHLCGHTEVVLCALQFHNLETSCFPHWGLAWLLFPISWPVLPLAKVSDQWLAFSTTFDLPYPCSQQMLTKALFVLLTDWSGFQGNNVLFLTMMLANSANRNAVIIYSKTLDRLHVQLLNIMLFSRQAVKWEPGSLLWPPAAALSKRNMNSIIVSWRRASVASSVNQRCNVAASKKKRWSP